LPEFGLADAAASRAITLRQLLTHSSGIDGDLFVDLGRGDDATARFVTYLRGVGLVHAPGARFSYCNAGFVVAGRLVEVLRGASFDAVLRERILAPLGLRATGTLPEQAILQRAAVGHFVDPNGTAHVVPVWSLQHSNAPAGATPFTTAGELLAFARMHVDDGVAPGGARLLSAKAARAMRTRQIELHGSAGAMADAWGLGWELKDGIGGTLVGHSGVTIGQMAWLDVVPERRAGMALLTNGGDAPALATRVRDAVLREVAGVGLPPLPAVDDALRIESAIWRHERGRAIGSSRMAPGSARGFARSGSRWRRTRRHSHCDRSAAIASGCRSRTRRRIRSWASRTQRRSGSALRRDAGTARTGAARADSARGGGRQQELRAEVGGRPELVGEASPRSVVRHGEIGDVERDRAAEDQRSPARPKGGAARSPRRS
jgi:hypothetical protein